MSVRQSLGKVAVVPKGSWDGTKTYEFLDIVKYGGGSYIARKDVPIGTAITNTEYWVSLVDKGAVGDDGVSPAVTVTEITGGHRVTITDAEHPQGQSFAVMNGSGIPEDVKVALLDCFEHVAWIDADGQDYYDALYAALYPPADLVSISAVFNQGSAVIYDTDDLDTLRQYLTVTATMSDSTTRTVTNYALSGTLTVGTSVITVSYGGKTTTFNVTVSAGTIWDFQWDYTKGKLEDQDGWGSDISGGSSELVTGAERITAASSLSSYFQILPNQGSTLRTMTNGIGVIEVVFVGQLNMSSTTSDGFRITAAESSSNRIGINTVTGKFRIRDNSDRVSGTAIADYQNGTEYTVRLVMKGTTVDIYINGTLVAENTTPISQSGSTNSVYVGFLGSGYYVDLKSLKLKIGSIS